MDDDEERDRRDPHRVIKALAIALVVSVLMWMIILIGWWLL